METQTKVARTERQQTLYSDDLSKNIDVQKKLNQHLLRFLGEPETFPQIPTLEESIKFKGMQKSWEKQLDDLNENIERPHGASQFKEWYFHHASRHENLVEELCTFLAHDASITDIAKFFVAEEQVDSKFDDLMALSQLGTSGSVKMTIAENFWDEMGEGNERMVHTTLFQTSVGWMKQQLVESGIKIEDFEYPEVYANANQLLMYGVNREWNPRLIGALGVLEESAPVRFQAMVDGCERLNVPEEVTRYQSIHVHVDENHGEQWFEYVLMGLVDRSDELREEICKGVLNRCTVAVNYYQKVLDILKTGR